MGKYRLGDIICMTRKSLSITQEQLCEGICSVETLSRVENGKQNPSRDTYELLMERMGRSRERAYSIMSISEYHILEKMKLFEDYIEIYDYVKAEIVLDEIKKTLGYTNLDRQFFIRAENIINYRLKRINAMVFLDNLENAILLTIPQYGKISLSRWPLNFHEVVLMLNISSAYAQNKNYIKAIEILEDAYNVMNQSYMDEQKRVLMQSTICNNLSKWYGLIDEYEKAIEIAKDGIEICKKHRLGHVLPNLLYSIVWNTEKLIDKGALPPERKKECMVFLKQSYYISCAMQQPFIEQFMLEHINAFYENVLVDQIIY
jgi:transcriptional regulator with XRE-family HTH domain